MTHHWRKPALSDHFKGKKFFNLEDTPNFGPDSNIWKAMREVSRRPADCRPPVALPSAKQDLRAINTAAPAITWFGHSSYLLSWQGAHILVDPVFSGYASPIPGMVPAFPGSNVYSAADMPDLDLLVLTHNHYDHMDYGTIKQLLPRVKRVLLPLGVGASMPAVPAHVQVTELDWYERAALWEDVLVEMRPARHFSGRGLVRNGSLWSSLALTWKGYKIFLGGDSGYDAQFRITGHACGPFDLALLECGQYNHNWPYIHMFPEQTVQAAQDLGAEILQPVHWGKFLLSSHPWDEPVKRALKAAEDQPIQLATPMIGQTWSLDQAPPAERWWEQVG